MNLATVIFHKGVQLDRRHSSQLAVGLSLQIRQLNPSAALLHAMRIEACGVAATPGKSDEARLPGSPNCASCARVVAGLRFSGAPTADCLRNGANTWGAPNGVITAVNL